MELVLPHNCLVTNILQNVGKFFKGLCSAGKDIYTGLEQYGCQNLHFHLFNTLNRQTNLFIPLYLAGFSSCV